ncbi:MAG: PilT/PilU family type 4a pilus ATPase [Deltaproteobacteria bacterium]|nr:PilT/PilU family type 4a pilus ATPase [Deltaproteobacteria bacterium]
MAQLDQLLMKMVESRASDLHLSAGEPVRMRIDGELHAVADRPLSGEALFQIMREVCGEDQWQKYVETNDLDFAYSVQGVGRFRCNFLKQVRGMGAVFRVIPEKILSIDDLGLPEAAKRFPLFRSGLVLVTGPTGSGKSTTLAAIIDAINRTMSRHIITIEDPIEFVHTDRKSFIVQREVGLHAPSFSAALKDALSEDPDVILVGEMRDLEAVSLAVTAAEMGVLVLATVHANSAAKTVDRIVEVFPAAQKEQIRAMLAESLRGILAQQLLRRKEGKGRIVAAEIMFSSPGLANIIRDGNASKITGYIDANRAMGMQTLDVALKELVEKDLVSAEEASLKCNNKSV